MVVGGMNPWRFVHVSLLSQSLGLQVLLGYLWQLTHLHPHIQTPPCIVQNSVLGDHMSEQLKTVLFDFCRTCFV
jgi:hypothetical protein